LVVQVCSGHLNNVYTTLYVTKDVGYGMSQFTIYKKKYRQKVPV